MCGPCKASAKKIQAVNLFLSGKSFAEISSVLSVAEATAEVYTIDGYCAGAPIEFSKLIEQMNLSSADVEILCNGIKEHGSTLRNVRNAFQDRFSYNQIRLILAAMIQTEIH